MHRSVDQLHRATQKQGRLPHCRTPTSQTAGATLFHRQSGALSLPFKTLHITIYNDVLSISKYMYIYIYIKLTPRPPDHRFFHSHPLAAVVGLLAPSQPKKTYHPRPSFFEIIYYGLTLCRYMKITIPCMVNWSMSLEGHLRWLHPSSATVFERVD